MKALQGWKLKPLERADDVVFLAYKKATETSLYLKPLVRTSLKNISLRVLFGENWVLSYLRTTQRHCDPHNLLECGLQTPFLMLCSKSGDGKSNSELNFMANG